MKVKRALVPVLICTLLLCACDYIVLPDDLDSYTVKESKGWSAVATNVGKSDGGDLHIDLTIRNETGDWSAMQATAGRPAVLTTGDGKTTNCDTVFVSTGGHRLAPGFQTRGYTGGTKAEQKTQLVYVECKGAEASTGSRLAIGYSYVTGEYNYYYPDENKVDATLEVKLDEVASDLTYPIAEEIEGLIQKPGTEITAINDVILVLIVVERTDTGLQFTWQTNNPGEYPSYVHVGNPPVIGADGIIYGFYQTPDIISVPITPAGDKAQWTTETAVPQDVKGLYILLSVESKKQRLFVNYAVDITDR
ncbi:MAG: hypothetical protein JXM73_11955 [Anaerolineae bacterium]|nr:hypothetical protein [Anaerolineae bacterium]